MSVDEVMSRLTEARRTLGTAKDAGLRAAGSVRQAYILVGFVLGRQPSGAQLVAAIHAREKTLLGQAMAVDALITRVDAAIKQTRLIGDGRGSSSDGPPVD